MDYILTRDNATLDEVKPKDRVDGYPLNTPKHKRRFYESIPGLVTWLFILSPLIVSVLGIPEILVFYITFLMVFWTLRAFRFVYGLVLSTSKMSRDINTDWVGMLKKEYPSQLNELNYVYLCPTYKEDYGLLRESFKAMVSSDIGASKITAILATEEQFKDQQLDSFRKLKEEFGDQFKEMLCIVHPSNIAGEVVGVKGANINWATREYVKVLQKREEDISKYLLISVDSDWRPHTKFLSAIAYKYFTTPEPEKKFYASAIHTFRNNIWRVPPIVRIFSTTLTMVLMHNWIVSKKTAETFSAYIANLKTIHDTEYWAPDIQNDDTAFYWNALIRFNGNFSGVEVYLPTYNDAVENESQVKTHQSLYKQQYRWGWGIVIFPITLAALFENKAIPLFKKIEILYILFENRLFYLTVVYMLTLALPLLNLFSDQFFYSSAAYNLPKMLSVVMTSLMLLNIPNIYFRRKVYPVPKDWSIGRHLWDFVETFLITINMLTFSFLPFVQAQTEMMIGKGAKKKALYVTDKVSIKN